MTAHLIGIQVGYIYMYSPSCNLACSSHLVCNMDVHNRAVVVVSITVTFWVTMMMFVIVLDLVSMLTWLLLKLVQVNFQSLEKNFLRCNRRRCRKDQHRGGPNQHRLQYYKAGLIEEITFLTYLRTKEFNDGNWKIKAAVLMKLFR